MAQTVTVTGVDDLVQDGNIAYTIVTAPAASTDGNYNNMNASDVAVTNTDNDVAGITVNPTSGLTTTPAGSRPTFSRPLTTQAAGRLSKRVSPWDPTEGRGGPAPATFTTADSQARPKGT